MRRVIFIWPLVVAAVLVWMLGTLHTEANPRAAAAAQPGNTIAGAPVEYGADGWASLYGASGSLARSQSPISAAELDGLLVGVPGTVDVPDPLYAGQPAVGFHE